MKNRKKIDLWLKIQANKNNNQNNNKKNNKTNARKLLIYW